MMRRVLVALDGSRASWRALRYAARVFREASGLQIVLVHVASEDPAYFWDFGHILTPNQEQAMRAISTRWEAAEARRWKEMRRKALRLLGAAGVPASAVRCVLKRTDGGAAEGILAEARASKCDTIVLGRRGLGAIGSMLLGSVTNRVIERAKGRAVVITE